MGQTTEADELSNGSLSLHSCNDCTLEVLLKADGFARIKTSRSGTLGRIVFLTHVATPCHAVCQEQCTSCLAAAVSCTSMWRPSIKENNITRFANDGLKVHLGLSLWRHNSFVGQGHIVWAPFTAGHLQSTILQACLVNRNHCRDMPVATNVEVCWRVLVSCKTGAIGQLVVDFLLEQQCAFTCHLADNINEEVICQLLHAFMVINKVLGSTEDLAPCSSLIYLPVEEPLVVRLGPVGDFLRPRRQMSWSPEVGKIPQHKVAIGSPKLLLCIRHCIPQGCSRGVGTRINQV
mmetsp:Transcript_35653/g.65353  ORF Transcript_35653/g.65353 Transcript_35653/m.65353 type:complete len:291 (+) Transcript_35653:211-1083(+)